MNPPNTDTLATRIRPVPAGDEVAGSEARVLWSAFRVPPLGALFGGACVGLVESGAVLIASPQTADYSGVIYGIVLYSVLGLGGGVGLGVAAAILARLIGHAPDPSRSWTLSFLAIFCSTGFVISRFVLQRNVFAEGTVPGSSMVWLALGFLVFSLLFYAFVRNALAKTFLSFVLTIAGSLATYALFFVFWLMIAVAMMLQNREVAEVAPRPVAPELEQRPNILLVVVDTLRADALGTYGAPAEASPRFDAWAGDATVYEQAFAHSSWTRASFASLLTSSPSCANRCARKADLLADELVTLPEALQQHGYTTGAIVNNINITASFNFHQGFDTFEFLRPAYPFRASEASFRLAAYQVLRRVHERFLSRTKRVDRYYHDAPTVTAEAIDWLREHGQDRWFLMVQYMDPHDPYFPHPNDGTAYARVENPQPSLEEAEALAALYAGEVSYWDVHFGLLVDWLSEQGLAENTVVVVTSDHGEEFGEHGGFWHGTKLYEESIRVPLVVKTPAQDSGQRVKDPVRLMDVAPTMTDLAGADAGPLWQGWSLERGYALRAPKDRLVLAQVDFEGWVGSAVRDRDWKLIENRAGPATPARRPDDELYFLRTDPGEQQNLGPDPSASWSLDERRADLRRIEAATCEGGVDRVTRDPSQLAPEECEALKALGYLDAATRCGG